MQLLPRYRQRFALWLFHYCRLSNPFHVIVDWEHPRDLSPWMAGVLGADVHDFSRRDAFVEPLWQGPFPSPTVEHEAYFLSMVRGLL